MLMHSMALNPPSDVTSVGWPSPSYPAVRLASLPFVPIWRWLHPSCKHLAEGAHADQVVDRRREDEDPVAFRLAPVAGLPQQPDRLQPAEDLLDPLAHPLADLIAGMPGRASVDGARAAVRVLGHMRGELHGPQRGDELPGVVRLVGPDGPAPPWLHAGRQLHRRLPLGCARRRRDAGRD